MFVHLNNPLPQESNSWNAFPTPGLTISLRHPVLAAAHRHNFGYAINLVMRRRSFDALGANVLLAKFQRNVGFRATDFSIHPINGIGFSTSG